ncbi:dipeptidase [Thalassospira alkalitolerans]|uniref:dipeptidase n=1 Tax=Thalassospira alkalitolerans TaxID=1293890 RepID=UPI0030EF089E|tara:strand:+ start:56732 stop:57751 length:1020 start_codon:yes stop_codon:yes gene_type:complete
MNVTTAPAPTANTRHRPGFTWDAHACLPLDVKTPINLLDNYVAGNVDYVCVNVGMDMNSIAHIMRVIAAFRAKIAAHPDKYMQIECFDDLAIAKSKGLLGVGFDLEGSVMLQDMPEMIPVFAKLGVTQIHFAYNRNNSVAGGCHDIDIPLTDLGREMVKAVNAGGMIMDCSHTGRQSSLDIMKVSTKPVVFSHANPKVLGGHERCVDDEQIKACADTGGVIGICGFQRFIKSPNAPEVPDMIRHIDYAVKLVGIDHVGIGLDTMPHVPGTDDFPDGIDRAYYWPAHRGYGPGAGGAAVFDPKKLPALADALIVEGYTPDDVDKIMGENFLRVAKECWTV